ncbi:ABC transporter substrate-binding protein [Romboutsia sedimentorum]|uniref:ABC transporter substrate-binding protein n=1 Tax=Romboutsia sedimentorum TaxID=1368474 RepID=A0ABT7ED45_9FIRM|nr:ABC transporter substrate-binding protein [Romboutsia sedimentorum]MDK2564838.1 ABC transporter substrate-binding protein [Romboutsia sedimentorum]
MKKLIPVILSMALGSTFLMGCTKSTQETSKSKTQVVSKEVKVSIPDGLPSIAIAKLANENTHIQEGYEIKYTIEKTPENLSTSVMKQEPDIAIVPSNMAAIAYNKTSNYQIAGSVGNGSFYLVSTKNIKGFEDLVGGKVLNSGKGLTPDITVQSVLTDKGIDPASINFDYVNSTSELIPLLATGKADTGFVPEPALTMLMNKNPNIKIIKSLNDEWKQTKKSKDGYPQSTIIVKSDFAKENQEFIGLFLNAVSDSVDFANINGSDVGDYAKKLGASVEPKIINKSLERANLKFISIKDSINDYKNYYQNLFDFDAKSVGGKIPDEGIYFIKE